MIKNGRPYINEKGVRDFALITERSLEEQEIVKDWIYNNIWARKTPMYKNTSYGIKHLLQSDVGIYLTNNEFKDAMLACGFKPVDQNALNWAYCISKRSPAFKKNRRK
jgi:hypothetical protein